MAGLAVAYGESLEAGSQPRSLVEGLIQSVDAYPDGHFVFLRAGGDTSASYAEVLARARRIAGGLQRRGVNPGDKLILYFQDFAQFVPALWAAIFAGAVPLPLMKNDWSRRESSRAPGLFAHLATVLDGPLVITDIGEGHLSALPGTSIALSSLEDGVPIATPGERAPGEPHLLILTSGTTGRPNLVALGAQAIVNRWWPNLPDPHNAATFLSWSPFDHVMGLGLASPSLQTKVHLPTSAFVLAPELWLTAMERHRVTHATMTNFGMALVEHAARDGVAAGKSWDLSSVSKIGVGAETVSPDVCRRFIARLKPFGLRNDTVILGYGLSECGPVAGGSHPFVPGAERTITPFALLDRPTRGHAIRIVSSEGKALLEGDVGAVEVRGPTMTLGYYRDEPATRDLFTIDGWLRTGDLGRLDDGKLTITGREKEIIIVRAKKFASVEIEQVAQSVVGIQAAFAVACADRTGGTSGDPFAVFVVPLAAPSTELLRRIRTLISAQLGIAPIHVIPIEDDDIPRTSSGKVQRLELAARLDAGEFDGVISALKPPTPTPRPAFASEAEWQIARIWKEILGVEDFGRDDDFFEIGGDSLSAEGMILAVERALGRSVAPELLQRGTTIARLAGIETDQSGINDIRERTQSATHDALPAKGDKQDLPWALATAQSTSASLRDRYLATDFLVAYGMVEEADAALLSLTRVLKEKQVYSPRSMGYLTAINRRFRRAQIDRASKQLGKLGARLLSNEEEAVLWKAPRATKLVVVFNSRFGDFWVSGPVLHCLLRDHGASVLQLKDRTEDHFLNGLTIFPGGFGGLCSTIRETADRLKISDIRMMAFSSGGYAGLLAATRMGAKRYLGFSIRSDLHPGSDLPQVRFRSALPPPPEVLVDLASEVRASGSPQKAVIYYGTDDEADALHARHLADIPNLSVREVPGARHNTLLPLLADGSFERELARFLR